MSYQLPPSVPPITDDNGAIALLPLTLTWHIGLSDRHASLHDRRAEVSERVHRAVYGRITGAALALWALRLWAPALACQAGRTLPTLIRSHQQVKSAAQGCALRFEAADRPLGFIDTHRRLVAAAATGRPRGRPPKMAPTKKRNKADDQEGEGAEPERGDTQEKAKQEASAAKAQGPKRQRKDKPTVNPKRWRELRGGTVGDGPIVYW